MVRESTKQRTGDSPETSGRKFVETFCWTPVPVYPGTCVSESKDRRHPSDGLWSVEPRVRNLVVSLGRERSIVND